MIKEYSEIASIGSKKTTNIFFLKKKKAHIIYKIGEIEYLPLFI